jgi:hypothetical protein
MLYLEYKVLILPLLTGAKSEAKDWQSGKRRLHVKGKTKFVNKK